MTPDTEPTMPDARYAHEALIEFAQHCLLAMDVDPSIAAVVARRVVDADLYGHATHGLALLPRYLKEIDEGATQRRGEIRRVSEKGACLLWDAGMLPGHWVLHQAIQAALQRVPGQGMVSIAVRHSQHIGALQVYLPDLTEAGYLCLLWATDTKVRSVAPFGGLDAVLTSEPIAAGIPTRGTPILIDTTTSLTSNSFVKQVQARGERLPWPALLSAQGQVTDDPGALATDPPGTILPLGGMDHGYKGYAMAMLVGAMSLGLSGLGRLSGEKAQGFLLQVIDPDAFAGRDIFLDEMQALADATRAARPIDPARPVRVPGDAALARAARQRRDGVSLGADIPAALEPWTRRLGVPFPPALRG
ncbi:Ldh family oxidoreductase [Bordetella petrii]|uniref:Ldh family oxidoreductase n=1 Tax=Bordetella petrii TaxID=94624 RepID=UPI001A9783C2|nr:Ldh family oxidoreductase [Bordetella petrii]MBO1113593.1 Ldh family oxidoreductase [Bordetella petrii]